MINKEGVVEILHRQKPGIRAIAWPAAVLFNTVRQYLAQRSRTESAHIDEPDFMPMTRDQAILFFQLIVKQSGKKSTILTSPLSFD